MSTPNSSNTPPASPDQKREYQSMRITARHPSNGEMVVVLVSSFENSISAVLGALGRLGIECGCVPQAQK